jgi:hypothetical protein
VSRMSLTPEQAQWSERVKSDAQIALLDMEMDLPLSRWRDACNHITVEGKRALFDVRRDTLEVLYLLKAKGLASKRVRAVVNGISLLAPFDNLPTKAELIEAKLWLDHIFCAGLAR